MEKEFVPYELAVKLKEIGFDEPCFGKYDGRGKNKGKIWYEMSNSGQDSIPVGDVLSPLYQQAFRWFREKYGLRIRNYGSINYSKELSEYFEVFKYGYGTSDKSLSIVVGALIYEKAELACLAKLIEIVEQTKK